MKAGRYTDDVVLAYDFGGTKTAVAVAATTGEIIEKKTFSTIECGDAEVVLEQALLEGEELVRRALVERFGRLASIGISTMGITMSDKVIMAPNVPGWENLRMRELFEGCFPGVSIEIENDVKAAALAELTHGELRDTEYGLYVNMGTGIAAVLTLRGEVVRGHNGSAGEIAYAMRGIDESRGYRSGLTPFEAIAGGGSIRKQASEYFKRETNAFELFELKRQGDAEATKFIDAILREVAFQITNTCILWDPGKVVVGGGMVGAKDIIFPVLQDAFEEFVPFPPTIKEAAYHQNAGLYGAIELAKIGLVDGSESKSL